MVVTTTCYYMNRIKSLHSTFCEKIPVLLGPMNELPSTSRNSGGKMEKTCPSISSMFLLVHPSSGSLGPCWPLFLFVLHLILPMGELSEVGIMYGCTGDLERRVNPATSFISHAHRGWGCSLAEPSMHHTLSLSPSTETNASINKST